MKNAIKAVAVATLVAASIGSAFAQVSVHGHFRQSGTYVAPYQRTAPDHTLMNNYSTQGNVNLYTGQSGTVNPYR